MKGSCLYRTGMVSEIEPSGQVEPRRKHWRWQGALPELATHAAEFSWPLPEPMNKSAVSFRQGTKPAASSPGQPKFCVADLFAGIGCVAQGFERTKRFETVFLNDVDKSARDTYVANFPGAFYLRRNVSGVRPDDIFKAANRRPVAGILGCPPCQGFSAAGTRDEDDPRNALLGHYFRLVQAILPPFILMENVPQVLGYDLFQRRLSSLEKQYVVWKGVLNAALYGVPQTRQRAIVIGYRRDLGIEPTAPRPTHLGDRLVFDYASGRKVRPSGKNGARALGLYPGVAKADDYWEATLKPLIDSGTRFDNLVNVSEAIGDLPPAVEGKDVPLLLRREGSVYARSLRSGTVYNHVRWNHTSELVRRLETVPEGGGLLDEEHGRAGTRPYFSQAYSRLHRAGLARTITTNFHNPGSGRFLHYADVRSLTVREAARLQGIPDSFRFSGHRSVQERLVGNAFPVPLAEALANHILSELDEVLTEVVGSYKPMPSSRARRVLLLHTPSLWPFCSLLSSPCEESSIFCASLSPGLTVNLSLILVNRCRRAVASPARSKS